METLGAIPSTIPMADIYTALQTGVVDGTNSVNLGFNKSGYSEVTKYIINPQMLIGNCIIVVNLNSWNKLSPQHQKLLTDTWAANEKRSAEYFRSLEGEEQQLSLKAGMQLLKFPEADEKWLIDLASKARWADLDKRYPELTAQMKKLLLKSG